jgi:hypothetical protein
MATDIDGGRGTGGGGGRGPPPVAAVAVAVAESNFRERSTIQIKKRRIIRLFDNKRALQPMPILVKAEA